jgi:hypothetical protein
MGKGLLHNLRLKFPKFPKPKPKIETKPENPLKDLLPEVTNFLPTAQPAATATAAPQPPIPIMPRIGLVRPPVGIKREEGVDYEWMEKREDDDGGHGGWCDDLVKCAPGKPGKSLFDLELSASPSIPIRRPKPGTGIFSSKPIGKPPSPPIPIMRPKPGARIFNRPHSPPIPIMRPKSKSGPGVFSSKPPHAPIPIMRPHSKQGAGKPEVGYRASSSSTRDRYGSGIPVDTLEGRGEDEFDLEMRDLDPEDLESRE